MNTIDIWLHILMLLAFLFSVVELGFNCAVIIAFNNYGYKSYQPVLSSADFAPPYAYTMFCCLWTIILLPAWKIYSVILFQRGTISSTNKWAGPVAITLNGSTLVFWVGSFAYQTAVYGLFSPLAVATALFSISCILWPIFLALFILNFLTTFWILKSERLVGYGPIPKREKVSTPVKILDEEAELEVASIKVPQEPDTTRTSEVLDYATISTHDSYLSGSTQVPTYSDVMADGKSSVYRDVKGDSKAPVRDVKGDVKH